MKTAAVILLAANACLLLALIVVVALRPPVEAHAQSQRKFSSIEQLNCFAKADRCEEMMGQGYEPFAVEKGLVYFRR